jgi:hypothetical protein
MDHEVTYDRIMQTAMGFWASKTLVKTCVDHLKDAADVAGLCAVQKARGFGTVGVETGTTLSVSVARSGTPSLNVGFTMCSK